MGRGNKIAADYIRDNFEPSDRLAVVLVRKLGSAVMQRLTSAAALAEPDFQDWLWEHNLHGYEVYVSMNALHPAAEGRTKQDVATIRHLYLDFDSNGTAAVDRLLQRDDLPTPNYRVSSSPGRWQVVWKVAGFSKQAAEELQRGLARQTGADPAATDCARVLRLPGYYNHKYGNPHAVTAETLAVETYRPERFPAAPKPEHIFPGSLWDRRPLKRSAADRALSQSERDWAFAKRALARGESPERVIAAMAHYRRFEKHNPQYYAELTVRNAVDALASDEDRRTPRDRR